MKKNRTLKDISVLYRPYLKWFVYLGLFLTIAFIFCIGGPILLTKIIERVTDGLYKKALYTCIWFLFFLIMVDILHGIYEVINRNLKKKMELDIRDQMIEAINNCKIEKLDEVESGVIISRINEDTYTMFRAIIEIMSSIAALVSWTGYLIYIGTIDLFFFFFYLGVTILFVILNSIKYRYYYKKFKIVKEYKEKGVSIYNEVVRGYKDIKCLNMKDSIRQLSKEKMEIPLEMNRKLDIAMVLFFRGFHIILNVFYVLVFVIGIIFLKQDWLTLATFIIVYTYFDRVTAFSVSYQIIKEELTNLQLAGERILEIIEDYPKEQFGNKSVLCEYGKIEFRDVSFGYDQNLVLKNINLIIKPNSLTAIVGKSGAGKSTILGLLNYLYSGYSGEILIDDYDIRELDERSIRSNVSVVNQTPYMFDLSIKDNMKLVNKNISDQEIWDVLENVALKDYVESLENGIDTNLGENGVSLSGGQRQRLAIARSLIAGSKIIVLDEATSALDNNTQQEIVNVINKLKESHTILVIAHRLSTIKDADNIYVLNNGEIVGEGNHKVLMKKNKVYQNLYQSEEL